MRAQVINKNGFPKLLGLVFIFILISLLCFVQCIFDESANAKTTDIKFDLPEIELEAEIQVEAWSADVSYWNKESIYKLQAMECEPGIIVKPQMVKPEIPEQEQVNINTETEIEEWMENKYNRKDY